MRVPRKRCAHCRCWFLPDLRTAATQSFCSRKECRRESRRATLRRWWRANAAYNAARASKLRAWAKNTGYWRRYRAGHPDYTRRDNERRRQAKGAAKRAAKQDVRRAIAVGKLRDILALTPDPAAKQDMILRRVDGLVDYLLWKEGAAKQKDMVLASAAP